MGIDYECGCRQSGGHWFLCNKHEQTLEDELVEYTDASFFKDVLNYINTLKLSHGTEIKEDLQNHTIILIPNAGCFTHNDFLDITKLHTTYKTDIEIAFHIRQENKLCLKIKVVI